MLGSRYVSACSIISLARYCVVTLGRIKSGWLESFAEVQLRAVILFVQCHYGNEVCVPSVLEFSLSFNICLNRFLSREKGHLYILLSYGLESPLYWDSLSDVGIPRAVQMWWLLQAMH